MRFELLQWEASLAPSLAESANDARIARFLRDSFPYPYSPEDAEAEESVSVVWTF